MSDNANDIQAEPQAAVADIAAAQPEVPEQPKPEWLSAIEEVKAENKRLKESLELEIQRTRSSLGRDTSKAHAKITALRSLVNEFVPELKREQFASDQEYQQAVKVLQPIRQKAETLDADLAKQEREETERQEIAQHIDRFESRLKSVPAEVAASVITKYRAALNHGMQYDLDRDMIAIIGTSSQGPAIMDALYSDPNQVLAIKQLSPAAKAAALFDLALQSRTPAPVTQPAAPVVQQVNAPAAPPRSGGGQGRNPLHAQSAADYLRAKGKIR